ncbi:MAG: hypothetical protein JWR18_1338, partial [Segetibacter sp.]|nr:hypothetical protein [Segetibacter sp.]
GELLISREREQLQFAFKELGIDRQLIPIVVVSAVEAFVE